MVFQKNIGYSLLFASVIFFLSMFSSLIPCQIAPAIPNPNYSWKMCTLNPDSYINSNFRFMYLGYSESLLNTYLIVFISVFVLSMVLIQLMSRHKKKQ